MDSGPQAGLQKHHGGLLRSLFLSKIVFWQATGFSGFLLERIMLSVVTAGLSGVDTSIYISLLWAGQSEGLRALVNSLRPLGCLSPHLSFPSL